MPKTMYDEDDEDDVVDVPASRHDVPPAGQTEGQHAQHAQHQQAASQPAQHAAVRPDAGPAPTLHAEWDKSGRCWVALFQGDKQLEKWRPPSREEWDALAARGKLVRPSTAIGAVAESGGTWLDKIKKNAVPFALGGAVVFGVIKVLSDRAAAGDSAGDGLDEEAEV